MYNVNIFPSVPSFHDIAVARQRNPQGIALLVKFSCILLFAPIIIFSAAILAARFQCTWRYCLCVILLAMNTLHLAALRRSAHRCEVRSYPFGWTGIIGMYTTVVGFVRHAGYPPG